MKTISLLITLSVPDGVTATVTDGTPAAASVAPPSDVAAPSPEFPPYPPQAPSPPYCKNHNKPMKPGRGGGWFCPTKVGDGWCDQRVNP